MSNGYYLTVRQIIGTKVPHRNPPTDATVARTGNAAFAVGVGTTAAKRAESPPDERRT